MIGPCFLISCITPPLPASTPLQVPHRWSRPTTESSHMLFLCLGCPSLVPHMASSFSCLLMFKGQRGCHLLKGASPDHQGERVPSPNTHTGTCTLSSFNPLSFVTVVLYHTCNWGLSYSFVSLLIIRPPLEECNIHENRNHDGLFNTLYSVYS